MASLPSMTSSYYGSLSTPEGVPEFVTELPAKLKCVLCKQILRNAMQTSCGHRLCEDCIGKLFEKKTPAQCPANDEDCEEQERDKINRDASARREILNLLVYCEFKQYGCQAKIKWKELHGHVADCEYSPSECPNKQHGCVMKLPMKKLKKHADQECDYRLVPCDLCKDLVPKIFMEKHKQEKCPRMKIKCRYSCNADEFLREKEQEHFLHCPSKPFKCEYHHLGCEFQGTQQEAEQHTRDSMERHMNMVREDSNNKDLKINELRMTVEDLGNEVGKATARNIELEKQVKVLQEKDENHTKKITGLQKTVAGQADKTIALEAKMGETAKQEQMDRQVAEIVVLKETQQLQDDKLNRIQREGAGTVNLDPLKTQLHAHDRTLGIHDVRLAEVDLRFQVLETASYDGVLIWKIRDYTRRKQEAISGKTLSLYSQPFYTSRFGYKMCARVYLNGDGMGKGTHMSLFFVVMRGDYDALLTWPFKQKVTLMLLDQDAGRRHLSDTFRPDPTSTSFKRPTTDMNIASGCPLFVSQSVLESKTYVKDDTIFIKVVVDTSDLYGP